MTQGSANVAAPPVGATLASTRSREMPSSESLSRMASRELRISTLTRPVMARPSAPAISTTREKLTPS